MKIPFIKCQSTGNDFILVMEEDLIKNNKQFLEEEKIKFYSVLAKKICERRFGIGGDGLLIANLSAEEISMRTFNADGTPDFCMNGLHCLASYLFEEKKINQMGVIEQLRRRIQVKAANNGFVSSLIPAASFAPSEVPLRKGLPEFFMVPISVLGSELVVSALSTGTSHTVVVDDFLPEEERFIEVSKALENHPFFPERTSVVWVAAQDEHHLKIRIWERGVGETFGCGTGSAAVAAVWSRCKNVQGDFEVSSIGGSTIVNLEHWDQPIWITTKPQLVFKGFLYFDPNIEALHLKSSH